MNKQEVLNLLDAKGIPYDLTEHAPVFTIGEMMAEDLPHPEAVAKNLFVRDGSHRSYYLLSVQEEKRVDLKAFSKVHGTRRLCFASEEDLLSILGLTRGSVTPFGLLNDTVHQVFFYLDKDLAEGVIGIHPNDNTATVWLNASDLLELLASFGCRYELASF